MRFLITLLLTATAACAAKQPNVLLIILDDQNAYAGRTDIAPQPVTPNLDRLAKRGVTFSNAQCAAPVCNPSRTAMLSGLRPSTTGIYDNDQDTMPADHLLRQRKSLPACFHDNGYQFGEKHYWSKGRLWEGSAHVPLVIAGPGVERGKTSTRPVSLLDLYPTLLESAGLPQDTALEGKSIVPLLRDPGAPWDRPAMTTSGFKNHALRSERWRCIRYADGSEELYDHDSDPLERDNLAGKPEFAAVKKGLQEVIVSSTRAPGG